MEAKYLLRNPTGIPSEWFNGIIVRKHIPVGSLLYHHGMAQVTENIVFYFTFSCMNSHHDTVSFRAAACIFIAHGENNCLLFPMPCWLSPDHRTNRMLDFYAAHQAVGGKIKVDAVVSHWALRCQPA
jgi:hypothetical protein